MLDGVRARNADAEAILRGLARVTPSDEHRTFVMRGPTGLAADYELGSECEHRGADSSRQRQGIQLDEEAAARVDGSDVKLRALERERVAANGRACEQRPRRNTSSSIDLVIRTPHPLRTQQCRGVGPVGIT